MHVHRKIVPPNLSLFFSPILLALSRTHTHAQTHTPINSSPRNSIAYVSGFSYVCLFDEELVMIGLIVDVLHVWTRLPLLPGQAVMNTHRWLRRLVPPSLALLLGHDALGVWGGWLRRGFRCTQCRGVRCRGGRFRCGGFRRGRFRRWRFS